MQDLIDKYKLIPHPEGGHYAVVYESKQAVTSPVVNEDRKAITHIYFLLLKGQVSIFHKVVHDEIWNFYDGDPLKLIKYDGSTVEENIIGSGCSDYVSIVEGGVYQAAESTGRYSLVGCSVAPGFEFEDFSFLCDQFETKEKLLKKLYFSAEERQHEQRRSRVSYQGSWRGILCEYRWRSTIHLQQRLVDGKTNGLVHA